MEAFAIKWLACKDFLYWQALDDDKICAEYYDKDSTASLEEIDDGVFTTTDSTAPPEAEETDGDDISTTIDPKAPPEENMTVFLQ